MQSMLKDEIQKAILTSLKGKKPIELKVLRFVLSQIKYEEIAQQRELSNEEIVSLLQKEVKKRKEAIELFKNGKREDLVTDEEAQLTVIGHYLPKQLESGELDKIIKETIDTAADKTNRCKLIGLVMVKVKGRADGKTVAELVKKSLNS